MMAPVMIDNGLGNDFAVIFFFFSKVDGHFKRLMWQYGLSPNLFFIKYFGERNTFFFYLKKNIYIKECQNFSSLTNSAFTIH